MPLLKCRLAAAPTRWTPASDESLPMNQRTAPPPHPEAESEPASGLGQSLLAALGEVPHSSRRPSAQPEADSRRLAASACRRAALAAGTLALPLGPLGWLTLLPEMRTVWKIQARLVADIAALHGRQTPLTREELVYCLFRHSSGSLLRDLVVRVGERSLVQRVTLQALQMLARRIGARLAARVAGKSLARWVPVAGAVGVGAYAYWDTRQVAQTALELFATEVVLPSVVDMP